MGLTIFVFILIIILQSLEEPIQPLILRNLAGHACLLQTCTFSMRIHRPYVYVHHRGIPTATHKAQRRLSLSSSLLLPYLRHSPSPTPPTSSQSSTAEAEPPNSIARIARDPRRSFSCPSLATLSLKFSSTVVERHD
ncbi:hypothetical protein NMG60_11012748 [Bertholletia excelsa]